MEFYDPVFLSIIGYVIIIGSSLVMFLIRRKKESGHNLIQ